jgi:hypothetical protein
MAKAHWEADTGHDVPWEDLHPDSQALDSKRMRAALLALAEVELPDEAIRMGANPYFDEKLLAEEATAQCFRAMLRTIAEDQP